MPDATWLGRRRVAGSLLVALALAIGLWLAWVESRPTFDDTGVLVSMLVLVPALVAAIWGRRPWLWALLIGAPIPLVEVPMRGSTASLVALAFAGLGAAVGWAIGRAVRRSSP